MKKTPLVSIITPSFQQGKFIAETLKSVCNQTYKNIEHIVMDGGSNDETVNILKNFEGTYNLRWISEPDNGQSDAINKGVNICKGEIVLWLNSDDVLLFSDSIERAVKHYNDGEPDLLIGDVAFINNQNKLIQFFGQQKIRYDRLREYGFNINQPAVFLRKEILLKNKLRNGLRYAMDLDLWLRLGAESKIKFVSEVFSGERIYPGSKSSTNNHKEEAEKVRQQWVAVKKIPWLQTRWRNIYAFKIKGLFYMFYYRYFSGKRMAADIVYLPKPVDLFNQFFRKISADYNFYWPSYIKKFLNLYDKFFLFPSRILYSLIIILKHKLFRSKGKLPDFLIIGVKKGGTTFLHHVLRSHPQIEMSPNFRIIKAAGINTKEVHFFNVRLNRLRGVEWYKSLFNNNDKLQGEATPAYIFWPEAREYMSKVVPNAKLIVILREPVKRAYSDYNHYTQTPYSVAKRWKYQTDAKSFLEMVNLEIERKAFNGIVSRGFYDEQLSALFKLYPREQVLVLISERLHKNPETELQKVFEFLGVSTDPYFFRREVHSREYSEPMSEEARKRLQAIYKEHNEKLFEILGYRIPEWETK